MKTFEDIFTVFIAFIMVTIIGTGTFVAVQEYKKEMEKEPPVIIEKLYTIDTSTRVSGRFVMGSRRAEEKEYYCCYKLLDDGGKEFVKYPMADTTIYETLKEGEQPYAETDIGFWKTTRKIYVPENTIIQEYDLSIPK